EEAERGGQVDGDIVHAGLDAHGAGAVHQEAVGRGQHHLEEDEEVEEVARQESAVEAHQQELEQRVEMRASGVPAGKREDERRYGEDRRQDEHQRRKPINHQHDAEGGRPVAQQIDALEAFMSVARQPEQADGDGDKRQAGDNADHCLHDALTLVEEQQQCARDKRNDDRRDDEVLLPTAHFDCSLPSTWSVPVRPRAASSTTRKSAVVAKPMTMAVSTSACGTGSVTVEMSTPSSSRGAALDFTPPTAKLKRFTA